MSWHITYNDTTQPGGQFDYYIGPNGVDTNPGTLPLPWSMQAINSKQATYAGRRLGIIGDQGPYLYYNTGSGQLSIYSAWQAMTTGSTAVLFNVNGGPSIGQPTYVAPCNSAGQYVRGLGDHCPVDPATGNRPTVEGGYLGQGFGKVTQGGNITLQGFTVHYTCGSTVYLQPNSTGTYPYDPALGGSGACTGVQILDCHFYDMFGNGNDNIAHIATYFQYNGLYSNNLLHDITIQASTNGGNSNGIGTFNVHGMTYQYNTIFNTPTGIHDKTQGGAGGKTAGADILQYNLIETVFVSGASAQGAGIVGCGYPNSGETWTAHHNIVYCPGTSWSFSSTATSGAAQPINFLFYNNTVLFGHNGLGSDWAAIGTSDTLYNNIVQSTVANTQGLLQILTSATVTDAYNCYADTVNNPTSSPVFGVATTYNGFGPFDAFTAYKTAIGSGGTSALSTQSFVGTPGQGIAENYQLATGSSGLGFGHVGGTGGGASCNAGAWDGFVTQIGCNFAKSLYPVILAPSVLPVATVGTPYTYQYAASGGAGSGSQTWALVSPAVTAIGTIAVSSSGQLTITPSAHGTAQVTVSCRDSTIGQTQSYTTLLSA